jgi:putative peptide zinc metalloprotease protein
MNLTRVLNVALPEIPARTLLDRSPRMPPDAVFKEHIEDGKPIVRVLVRSVEQMFTFTSPNWALAQLFDGRRSFEEIAEEYSREFGAQYSADDVREFAAALEAMNFWHKTAQEKNIQLMQKSVEERRKLLKSRKSRFGDLSEITFPAFNPDKFVTWLYRYTSFIYTWWFTLLTFLGFGITAGISITHWAEIGRDTWEFFNFTDKSWGDVAVFYILAVFALGWHELAHAHACKHYGGRVPAMGFLLIYLAPAFYTDTTEGFVRGSRPQRLIIAMAGAWSELMICAVVTPIWWGTPPGTEIHSVAYQLMLMTGIAAVMINWNPLMKLDGYYMLCEIIEVADLKEDSTAYVSAWVKRRIWGLPVDVPYVPRRRRLGFVLYALLSGAYSYTVLYVLARFVGNVFRSFNPEWSFIPELATAGLIFRSRIRNLMNFMKFVYLDKKERVHSWIRTPTALWVCSLLLPFLCLPVWHESVTGQFILESAQSVIVRTEIPGTITEILTQEGANVSAGAPLIRIRSIPLQSKVAAAEANLEVASLRTNFASLHYANLGSSLGEREQLTTQVRELKSQATELELSSPISGSVLSSRLQDRLGASVQAGLDLVEVADLSAMRARFYASEHDMHKIGLHAPVRLFVEGFPRIWDAQVEAITPVSSAIDPRLATPAQYKGLYAPNFFVVEMLISNSEGKLKPGMIGVAKIFRQRRSVLGLFWLEIVQFFGRKVW